MIIIVCSELLSDMQGLIPAVEVVLLNSAISNMIRTGKDEQIYSGIETGGLIGMQTMEESLYAIYRADKITKETVLKTAKNPALIMRRLNG